MVSSCQVWIESMNTVLDDNRTLCLANAERIKLGAHMHLLFEVLDLAVASPATVSRCGMVYHSASNLSWRSYLSTWAQRDLPPLGWGDELIESLTFLFDDHVPQGLAFIRSECREAVGTCDFSLVASLCGLFASLLTPFGLLHPAEPLEAEEGARLLFAFCFVWTIGSSIRSECWPAFDFFCRQSLDSGGLLFPPSGDVRDFVPECLAHAEPQEEEANLPPPTPAGGGDGKPSWDGKKKGGRSRGQQLVHWRSRMPQFAPATRAAFHTVFVPTIDSMRFSLLLTTNLLAGRPTLLAGGAGVGKTAVASAVMGELSKGEWLFSPFSFSAWTSVDSTQRTISSSLEKHKKGEHPTAPTQPLQKYLLHGIRRMAYAPHSFHK